MAEAPVAAPVATVPAPADAAPAPAAVYVEAAEEAEVAELKEMMKRPPNSPPRKSPKKKPTGPKKPQPEWNATPHRSTPPALRGIKTNREPWASDAQVYADGMSGHGAVRRRAQQARQPTREEMEREYREGVEKWKKEQAWNATPFRNAPWQIRGLNPVTREPWFEDMAICTPQLQTTSTQP